MPATMATMAPPAHRFALEVPTLPAPGMGTATRWMAPARVARAGGGLNVPRNAQVLQMYALAMANAPLRRLVRVTVASGALPARTPALQAVPLPAVAMALAIPRMGPAVV